MSGIPSWAVKGAKVVCVDDTRRSGKWTQITNGEVYIVAGIYVHDDLGVYVEIAGTYDNAGGLGKWRPYRFRPLHTLETDISEHFAQFLKTPSRQRELAE